MTGTSVTLMNVLTQAYEVMDYQIVAPSWLNSERFDIVAKIPAGASRSQYKLMLQNLLAERFKLTVHHEKKEMPVLQLVVTQNGPKLQVSESDAEHPAGEPAPSTPTKPALGKDGFPQLAPAAGKTGTTMTGMNGRIKMAARKETMPNLATFLAGQLGRPVLDLTGLQGQFDFILYWVQEGSSPRDGDTVTANDDFGPTLFSALQDQIGLKLEAGKGQVEILVIDHAEKRPTEN
jgi:uncharacterized protein (TIGR03435 family)